MQGWKTVIIAGAITMVGFLQTVNWVDLIPNDTKTVGLIVTVIGVVMAALRALTSTPIGKAQ